MALFCSREIFAALEGLTFPATKREILSFAEQKDAPESVVVMLNQLKDDMTFYDVGEVCDNARVACNFQVMRLISHANFPAKREALMDYAKSQGAPQYALDAIAALPSEHTFSSVDDACEYI